MKLSKAQTQVLWDRINARTPQPQPGQMPQMGMPGQVPTQMPQMQLPPEILEEAGTHWDEMQDGIGPMLYDGMHNESGMSRAQFPDGRESFVNTLGGMMMGQGKRDPGLQKFVHDLMSSKGRKIIPGYGIGDDADEEVVKAFYGMGG